MEHDRAVNATIDILSIRLAVVMPVEEVLRFGREAFVKVWFTLSIVQEEILSKRWSESHIFR